MGSKSRRVNTVVVYLRMRHTIIHSLSRRCVVAKDREKVRLRFKHQRVFNFEACGMDLKWREEALPFRIGHADFKEDV